jgi:hypothetical protein
MMRQTQTVQWNKSDHIRVTKKSSSLIKTTSERNERTWSAKRTERSGRHTIYDGGLEEMLADTEGKTDAIIWRKEVDAMLRYSGMQLIV